MVFMVLKWTSKSHWQRTLKDTDKASWQRIVEIYCGQYGVHLDPRIAYQKCQELQYSRFGTRALSTLCSCRRLITDPFL